MATRKVPPAVSEYFASIGKKGGSKGGRWAKVSAEERSEKMRAIVKKRWAAAKRKPKEPK